jgi:hypothetical protein
MNARNIIKPKVVISKAPIFSKVGNMRGEDISRMAEAREVKGKS